MGNQCCNKTVVLKNSTTVNNTIFTGSGAPAIPGNEGDLYFDTNNGDLYQYTGGSWGAPIDNLTGPAGADGQSIDHISQTAGTGAPGTTDTYTVWGDVGETINLGTFDVYNGADGAPGGVTESGYHTEAYDSADNTFLDFGGSTISSFSGNYEFYAVGKQLTIMYDITLDLNAGTPAVPFTQAGLWTTVDFNGMAPAVSIVSTQNTYNSTSYICYDGLTSQLISSQFLTFAGGLGNTGTLRFGFDNGIPLNTDQILLKGQIVIKLI